MIVSRSKRLGGVAHAAPTDEATVSVAAQRQSPNGSRRALRLLKSPFLLRPLMLRLPIDTLPGDHVGAPVAPSDPADLGAFTRCAATRSLCVTAPTAGAAAHPTASVAVGQGGPVAVGHALASLDRMAHGAPDRQA